VNAPLVSVIVPVFNEEKLLTKCLDSVINQSLRDIEILIVNDASTDNSETYINKYRLLDTRISVLEHSENKGLGEARNTGIATAKGKYLFFLDSDDSLPPNALEILSTIAETHHSQVVYGKTRSKKPVDREYIKCNLYNISIASYPDLLNNHSAWNKLIDRQMLEQSGIGFVPPRYAEDIIFSLRLNLYASSISIVNKITYHYRWGRQIGTVSKEKIVDAQGNVKKAYFLVKETGNNFLIERMKIKTVRNIYGNMRRALSALSHDDLVTYLGNWQPVIDDISSDTISVLPANFCEFHALLANNNYDDAIQHWKKSTNYNLFSRLLEFALTYLKN
jgi:glycosyltransferase involved in cell wall biosynthesis